MSKNTLQRKLKSKRQKTENSGNLEIPHKVEETSNEVKDAIQDTFKTRVRVKLLIEKVKILYLEEYDVKPELFDTFITPEIFHEFELVYEQMYFNLKYDITHALDVDNITGKDNINLITLNNNFDLSGLCGFITQTASNGIITFCNTHKHLHYSIKDHQFVQKTPETIQQERKQNLSLENTKKFFKNVFDYIYKRIKRQVFDLYVQTYFVLTEVQTQNTEKLGAIITELNDWMKNNKNCFKSTFVKKTISIKDTVQTDVENSNVFFIEIFIPKTNKTATGELENIHKNIGKNE